MIRCQTLGPVAVSVDGGELPAELSWRKNLALLVYLARSPRHARTRDHLVGLLWPEKQETPARHSLRESIRVLRRALGDHAVETASDQVRLVEGAVRLDVDDLAECMASQNWAGAVALIGGEFLEGFAVPDSSAFEDWMAGERSLWRGRCVDALVRAGEALLRSGHVHGAATCAGRATMMDPVSEPAVRLALRAHTLGGDQAGALRAFASFHEALQEIPGAMPSSESQALVARIRAGKIPAAPANAAPEEAGGATRRAPFAGRERELAEVLDAWRRAAAGGGAGLIVIEGDPGLGKTRLMEETVARAHLDGAAVSVVRAVLADANDPWAAVLGLARGGLLEAPGLAGAPVGALAAFATRLPEWADRFPRAARATPAPLGVAAREMIAGVAEDQPVLLAVDDAQWLDGESAAVFDAVLRDAAAKPVCVLLATTPETPSPLLDELRARIGRDIPGAAVTLTPMTDATLRVLAQWALPEFDAPALERVVRRVAVDSAGLPLLAVELLHAIALGLEVHDQPAAWPAPFRTLDHTLPSDLPDGIVAAIRVGFRRLSQDAQQVLVALSVLGERISPERVAAASGFTGERLNHALDELEWRRWVVWEPRGYGFVARIVRDVVARDMVTAGQRMRMRAAAGEAA
ncbi:MAG TPA: AAA family ATPase [Gemmatimonadales bacterium]